MTNISSNVPPNSPEAEKAILGAIFIDEECLNRILQIIPNENYFYNIKHKVIFKAIKYLNNKNLGVDILTVAQALDDKKILDKVGGTIGLSSFSDITPSTVNIEHYAKIVKDKYLLRRLIEINNKETKELFLETKNPESINAEYEEKRVNLLTNSNDIAMCDSNKYLINLINTFRKMIKKDKYLIDFSGTPFENIKIERGNSFIGIAGRPEQGKSCCGLQMFENNYRKYKGRHHIFGYCESSEDKLGLRKFCIKNKITKANIQDILFEINSTTPIEAITDKELIQSIKAYLNKNVIIETPETNYEFTKVYTIEAFVNYCISKHNMLKRQGKGLGSVYLDHLQEVDTDKNFPAGNIREKIDYILSKIRYLMGKTNCDFYLMIQLSRKVEDRRDKRPILSDLKESGGIEQKLDYCFSIMNVNYYGLAEGSDDNPTEHFRTDIIWKSYFDCLKTKEQENHNQVLAFYPAQYSFYKFDSIQYYTFIKKWRENNTEDDIDLPY